MTSVGIVRWDPSSRAGAVSMRRRGTHDCQNVADVSDAVQHWARYQNLAGEHDTVETSTIRGNYNWQSYIQEETTLARRRDEETRKGQKKVERPPTPPAPQQLYL